jgi:hypothetical protein
VPFLLWRPALDAVLTVVTGGILAVGAVIGL